MIGYLIDTNVFSEFGRPLPPDPRVKQWMQSADPNSLFASVITWGELRKGIESKPLHQRRPGLQQWLERDLANWFQFGLLPVTRAIADRWGSIAGQAKLAGRAADGLILATALEHGLVIVTRNVKDFAGYGVSILNPWDA